LASSNLRAARIGILDDFIDEAEKIDASLPAANSQQCSASAETLVRPPMRLLPNDGAVFAAGSNQAEEQAAPT
jgi:hypothetical protein